MFSYLCPTLSVPKRVLWRGLLLGSILGLSSLGVNCAHADTITLVSDGSTLGAAMGPGQAAPAMINQLDLGDTTGLTFAPVIVDAEGTFTPVPPGAPSGTSVINIAPGDGENGFYKVSFTLPAGFSNASLAGSANVDDFGRIFLNGNSLSPSLLSGDPNTISEFGNATFSTQNAAFFQVGENVLLLADDNTGGPSGTAFFATVSFNSGSSVPEPNAAALLLGLSAPSVLLMLRRRCQR